MSEHGAESGPRREEWEAHVAKAHAAGKCPFSGLTTKACVASICDCFIEQYPNDPHGLHPEAFAVATHVSGQRCPRCAHRRGAHHEECTVAICGCDWSWDDFVTSPTPPEATP